ncbi:MAG: DUF3084 domain-containing protein [Synergistaceae bacterium]|nr:DUF3084 domain-containing protein [Synergistaceae bacterium]
MFELFREMNWSLLGTLAVVSGIVAWAGDIIGMKLGKKRVTFLKLRPKYTSRIISVITGIGIALFTLFVISVASETVRTALFSMNYVQNQITVLTAELQENRTNLQGMEVELFRSKGDVIEKQEELQTLEKKLEKGTTSFKEARSELQEMTKIKEKTEKEQKVLLEEKVILEQESQKLEASVAFLKQEAGKLKADIQRLREGRIAALTGEKLAQGVINGPESTPHQVDQVLERLIEETQALLAYRFGTKPESVKRPLVDESSIDRARSLLSKTPGRYLLRLTALTNAVEGEPVMAELETYSTKLIFTSGDILGERNIKKEASREDVEETLFLMLRDVNSRAAKEGVLRDPLSGNVGSIDTAEFMQIMEDINKKNSDVILRIFAAKDIYTEGPVKIRFKIN